MANEFIARNGITSLGNIVVSGSITTTGTVAISGSIASASFAATASSADNFLTRGTLTAQTLVVQTITSSVDFVTGSTRFGSLLANNHVFSGSVSMNPGGLFVSSSGNVGVGITFPTNFGPTYKTLHVSSSVDDAFILATNPTVVSQFRTNGTGSGAVGTRSNHDFVFLTNNTEKAVITANGEFGIGTTPSSGNRLWVKGNDSTSSNTSLIAQNSSGNYLLLVRNDGKVGIGTNSPNQILSLLQSNSASATTLEIINSSNASTTTKTAQVLFQIADTAGTIKQAANIIAVPDGVNNLSSYLSFGTRSGDANPPVERLKISSGGQVTLPYQPAFYAYGVTGTTYGSGNYWIFPSTTFNRGSHYNTSNGIFTAPVAGVYEFSFSNLGGTGSTVYRYFLYINNSQTQQGPPLQLRMDKSGDTVGQKYGTNFSRTAIVNLAANDTVRVFYSSDTGETSYPNTNETNNEYCVFMGKLIG